MLSCELPGAPALEETLQNGVILCKLGMKLLPDDQMWNRVYDLDQSKFKVSFANSSHSSNSSLCAIGRFYDTDVSMILNPYMY